MFKVRYALLGVFLFYEIANFTGFSWNRFQWVPKGEIIDSAIRYNYPDIYSNLDDLKKDYSTFQPEISYWKDWTGEAGTMFWNKFFGMRDYQVRLPDAVVIVEADGKARFSRNCGDNWFCSPQIIPDHPKLGIVGTVQYGAPNYETAKDFSIRWINGSKGKVFISGHCFSAFSTSEKPTLEISSPGKKTLTIEGRYGYGLSAVFLTDKAEAETKGFWQGASAMKIPESEFLKSQSCDQAVRKAWPNVGGFAWKR